MNLSKIKTEADITPQVALELRIAAGLLQKDFWESVGSNQSSGHWFESGKRPKIPKTTRMMIFLMYVAGLELNLSEPEQAHTALLLVREAMAKYHAANAATEAREAEARAKQAARATKQVL